MSLGCRGLKLFSKGLHSSHCFFLVRFVAQSGGSCGVAVETAGRRMAVQLEGRLRETLELLRLKDQSSAAAPAGILQQLLSAARTQASRLTKLETSCFSSAGAATGTKLSGNRGAGTQEQEVTLRELALDGVLAALQQTRVGLEEALRSSRQRYLPAGEISIFPPAISLSVFTC